MKKTIGIGAGKQESFNWRGTVAAFISGVASGAAGMVGRAGSLRNLGAVYLP